MLPEPISLYLTLEAILSDAGWKVFAPNAPAPNADIVGKRVGLAISRGIQIRFDERDTKVAVSARALSAALTDAGISHEVDNSDITHPGAIELQIGAKE